MALRDNYLSTIAQQLTRVADAVERIANALESRSVSNGGDKPDDLSPKPVDDLSVRDRGRMIEID
jgi:hypothetical protein